MVSYINLKYRPKKEDLIAEFYLEPNRVSLEKAAEHIASESSIGTWTDVKTLNTKIIKRLKPNVFHLDKKKKTVKIAYPSELFERGNMPQILSSLAGNIFGMSVLNNLRLEDISFSESLIKSFKGPRFGIDGIRRLMKIESRPLLGTIVKPKVGLSEREHAKVAYEAWVGGMDIVKDDENLSNLNFNKFEKRIKETLKQRDRAEQETGEKKMYMPNVTAETNEMIRRAEFVEKQSCEYVMIDVITSGWAALQTLRNADLDLVIHAHRAGHAALTRNKKHGISMLVIAKISRLVGTDQLHIGTAHVGKMASGLKEEVGIEDALTKKMGRIKTTLPVASGGLHPGSIPEVMRRMGKNIVMQFGGGCAGHPDGTRAGATAIRQSMDAAIKGISLKDYSKNHPALKRALEKWG